MPLIAGIPPFFSIERIRAPKPSRNFLKFGFERSEKPNFKKLLYNTIYKFLGIFTNLWCLSTNFHSKFVKTSTNFHLIFCKFYKFGKIFCKKNPLDGDIFFVKFTNNFCKIYKFRIKMPNLYFLQIFISIFVNFTSFQMIFCKLYKFFL